MSGQAIVAAAGEVPVAPGEQKLRDERREGDRRRIPPHRRAAGLRG
ncbi:MAG TPA: hypothetical protein VIL85_15175 [Thermomicrobiales bacterium]